MNYCEFHANISWIVNVLYLILIHLNSCSIDRAYNYKLNWTEMWGIGCSEVCVQFELYLIKSYEAFSEIAVSVSIIRMSLKFMLSVTVTVDK